MGGGVNCKLRSDQTTPSSPPPGNTACDDDDDDEVSVQYTRTRNGRGTEFVAGDDKVFTFVKVPRRCSLVLLLKIGYVNEIFVKC